MGRFEKQPDNPRGRGDLSRSAENALWAVVEDLENLQQHVIRSMQEEIKRLQAEKNRLTDDIQRLAEEKEQLQQVRQVTEQQVLIRQLAEALAKHISSQLQSSLTTLANKALEQEPSERNALKSAEVSNLPQSANNENVEKLLDNLDDTLTITFSSLQQELKNYQSNISQQLSRMQNQQQQGEYILGELINRLQGLEKTITETSLKVEKTTPNTLQPPEEQSRRISPPTVLQLDEPPQNSVFETSTNVIEVTSNTAEPISAIAPDLRSQEIPPLPPVKAEESEPISVISPDLPSKEIPPLPPVKAEESEPISVISPDLSSQETNFESFESRESSQEIPPLPPVKSEESEPISAIAPDLTSQEISPIPPVKSEKREPIFITPEDVSAQDNRSEPVPSQGSSGLSPIQIGFLLVVLSTVLSSLYNVAIKVIFHQGAEILGLVEVERLLTPSLGNTFLILTLRLLVVVPLMLLLAPILHPGVWQDLQNLLEGVRGNPTRANLATKRVFQLSIASGCFLFLSQVLVYLAIGQIPTGMAIALFFVYPLVSGLLSWFLFRDRPNLFRTVAIGTLFCGELLVLGGANFNVGTVSFGGTTAILSGVAFAIYVILTRACASKLHPVSFTLINFATMLGLSFIGLMLPLPGEWSLVFDPSKLLEIVLSAFILGVLTLCGYVFNNIGIRKLGASRSAIIGAGVPILTVIFAGLLIQENLEIIQILGVLLVTFGAAGFSFDKMRNLIKSSNTNN